MMSCNETYKSRCTSASLYNIAPNGRHLDNTMARHNDLSQERIILHLENM